MVLGVSPKHKYHYFKWYTLDQVNSKSQRRNDYMGTQILKTVSKELVTTEHFSLAKKTNEV